MSQLKIQYKTHTSNSVKKASKLWKNSGAKAKYYLGK